MSSGVHKCTTPWETGPRWAGQTCRVFSVPIDVRSGVQCSQRRVSLLSLDALKNLFSTALRVFVLYLKVLIGCWQVSTVTYWLFIWVKKIGCIHCRVNHTVAGHKLGVIFSTSPPGEGNGLMLQQVLKCQTTVAKVVLTTVCFTLLKNLHTKHSRIWSTCIVMASDYVITKFQKHF